MNELECTTDAHRVPSGCDSYVLVFLIVLGLLMCVLSIMQRAGSSTLPSLYCEDGLVQPGKNLGATKVGVA